MRIILQFKKDFSRIFSIEKMNRNENFAIVKKMLSDITIFIFYNRKYICKRIGIYIGL